jgi:hypothetical protein
MDGPRPASLSTSTIEALERPGKVRVAPRAPARGVTWQAPPSSVLPQCPRRCLPYLPPSQENAARGLVPERRCEPRRGPGRGATEARTHERTPRPTRSHTGCSRYPLRPLSETSKELGPPLAYRGPFFRPPNLERTSHPRVLPPGCGRQHPHPSIRYLGPRAYGGLLLSAGPERRRDRPVTSHHAASGPRSAPAAQNPDHLPASAAALTPRSRDAGSWPRLRLLEGDR